MIPTAIFSNTWIAQKVIIGMSDFWNLPDGVEEIVPPLSTTLEKTKTELLDYFQNKGFDLISYSSGRISDSIGGLANEELSRSSFQFSDTNSERFLL